MSEKFEAKNIREVCALLATDPDRGLSEKEAAKRHETGGPNELKETKKKSALESFLEQLNELDGSFLKPYVNGNLEGYAKSPGGNINLYEIHASPGDLLTLTWEVYGETDTVELQLPEEVAP